ncbi:hypothetical protein BS47DRAFT_1297464 [Hydnum rufescens UP504]|uniref:Magnesium transporter n=1 Tax=Hydnum rufescens UP504 TaxID=1448309 RepID=A0A9P6DVF8_9AGAM|nr:hypothetical protein BS47DRAFT_1297464 [Hydnum rufescens UP504]
MFTAGIFFISNILGSVFQIASLPVVILAPLGAVSLLWNAFFARFLLGDEFSRFMILGTLLIVAGAILIGFYGIVPEPTHSLDDLLRLFGRKSFVVYFTLLGVAVLAILIVVGFSAHYFLSPSLSFMTLPPSRTPTLLAISYASMSGLLSGMCLLFAKSGVELLVLTVAGHNQFGHWQSWALVVGLVAFALLQLWYLHKSLILEDPTLVCPLAFCSYNLSSILNGLIYFDQYDSLSTKQVCLVMLGICILLGGVWALSQQDEADDVEGESGEITPVNGGIPQGDWGTRVIVGEDMNVTPPSSPMSPLPSRPSPRARGARACRVLGGWRVAGGPRRRLLRSCSLRPRR